MGSVESSNSNSSDKTAPTPPIAGQILISVHGSPQTGKTTLIKHMIKIPFSPFYQPTKQMESTQVIWQSIYKPEITIRVVVWDVVESAYSPSAPDARTVDTVSRADGIIVLYDPDDAESANYAISVLYKIPDDMPVLILANFLDLRGNRQKVHSSFRNVPFSHIQTSLKTGIGLDVIAMWLDKAMLYNRKKSLIAQLRSIREEGDEIVQYLKLKTEINESRLNNPPPKRIYVNEAYKKTMMKKNRNSNKNGEKKLEMISPALADLLREAPQNKVNDENQKTDNHQNAENELSNHEVNSNLEENSNHEENDVHNNEENDVQNHEENDIHNNEENDIRNNEENDIRNNEENDIHNNEENDIRNHEDNDIQNHEDNDVQNHEDNDIHNNEKGESNQENDFQNENNGLEIETHESSDSKSDDENKEQNKANLISESKEVSSQEKVLSNSENDSGDTQITASEKGENFDQKLENDVKEKFDSSKEQKDKENSINN